MQRTVTENYRVSFQECSPVHLIVIATHQSAKSKDYLLTSMSNEKLLQRHRDHSRTNNTFVLAISFSRQFLDALRNGIQMITFLIAVSHNQHINLLQTSTAHPIRQKAICIFNDELPS